MHSNADGGVPSSENAVVPSTSAALVALSDVEPALPASLVELDDGTLAHLGSSIALWWNRSTKIAGLTIIIPAIPVVPLVLLAGKGLAIALGGGLLAAAVFGAPLAAVVAGVGRRVVKRLARDEVRSLEMSDEVASEVNRIISGAIAAGGDLETREAKEARVVDALKVARRRALDP